MRRYCLDSAKRIVDLEETVDLFMNWFRSPRGPQVIDDSFVSCENHGGPHMSRELFIDARPASFIVVLSQGEFNGPDIYRSWRGTSKTSKPLIWSYVLFTTTPKTES